MDLTATIQRDGHKTVIETFPTAKALFEHMDSFLKEGAQVVVRSTDDVSLFELAAERIKREIQAKRGAQLLVGSAASLWHQVYYGVSGSGWCVIYAAVNIQANAGPMRPQ